MIQNKSDIHKKRECLTSFLDTPFLLGVVKHEGFQGLRSPKNRSLLGVNEDFEGKCNVEITLLDNFFIYTFSDPIKTHISELGAARPAPTY